MTTPVEVKVLRAWDASLITSWWDRDGEWFNLCHVKISDSGASKKTIRLSKGETETLLKVITHGVQGAA